MMSVKLLESNLNIKDEIIVDGYIREMENVLFEEHSAGVIPSVINQLCIEYYRIIQDRFDSSLHGDCLLITHDTVTTDYTRSSTAFLSNIVNKGIHHWKFEITKCEMYANIYIGVWENKYDSKKVLNSYIVRGNKLFRGYIPSSSLNVKWGELIGSDENIFNEGNDYGRRCPSCDEGDIVEMILEFYALQCELKFIVKGKELGTAFILPKTDYRAFVSFY